MKILIVEDEPELMPNNHVDHPPNVTIPTTQLMLDAACLRNEMKTGTALGNHPR